MTALFATTNIPLALLLGILASGCFASGATMQHLGIERNFRKEPEAADRAMTAKRMLKLLATPLWLLGTLVIGAGAAMHVVALGFGPLTVIQPVGILAVPFSIILASRIYHTKTTRNTWVAVVLTVVGIVTFTTLSSITAIKHTGLPTLHTIIAFCVVAIIGSVVCVIGAWKGPRWMANLAWAWAGAILYGLGSGFIKLLTIAFAHQHFGHLFWISLIGLALVYGVGAWMIQQAYASGPAEVVVGVMTTVDPVIAVVFGLVVLAEGRLITWPYALGMVVAALVSAYGVFMLSKHHPDVQQHREASATVATKASLVEEDHS